MNTIQKLVSNEIVEKIKARYPDADMEIVEREGFVSVGGVALNSLVSWHFSVGTKGGIKKIKTNQPVKLDSLIWVNQN
jgi:hypothetical protein